MNKLHQNFPLEKVFEFKAVKQAKSQKDIPTDNNGVPYVVQSTVNNMVARFVNKQYLIDNDEAPVDGNAIVLGVTLPAVSYQKNEFGASQVITARSEHLDEKTGIYLVGVLSKYMDKFSYQRKPGMAIYKAMEVSFPVIENPDPDHEYTVDDIDWQYMRDRITELERDRITELDTYLQATGLNDYELTEEDKKILSLSTKRASDEEGDLEDAGEDEVRFGEFSLDELFIKRTIKGVPKKEENLVENPNGYHIFGQNIKYQYEHKVLMNEKYLQVVEPNKPILAYTSSVGEIGMITESFYRTGDNGAFQGLFPLYDISEYAMRYVLTVLQKHFADFGYSTSMANIMSMKIWLPIAPDGTPDFDYMERYIRAIEKVVIADVVKYKDNVIETTKKVVGA